MKNLLRLLPINAENVNKAIVEVLSRRLYLPNVSPESIGVETKIAGQYLKFHLRMNKNYKVLPSIERVRKTYGQTGKQGEGAKYLLLGALQITGDKIRVTARIVEVETGILQRAAKGDDGTSSEGLCRAFEAAMKSLLICYVA